MTKQAMANLVDQCEAWGLVTRAADPLDARARRVCFTPTGLAWLQAFRDAVAQAEAEFRAEVGNDVATVVAIGLEAYADYGADDYMAKPFSLQELEARVRALTRRGMGGTSSAIKHGPLVYDQAGRVATIDGKMVELSARELGLLEVLLQRAGRLVSKEQLVERLCEWGEEVSNNAIEVYIHRLRKKIEKGPIRIATVRGLGYCLEKIPG
jgi:DNA-binding MarR family transcriptional regulator/biotin operon repressor